MPKVSIIVPFYNAEAYFRACLLSILQQDFPDWELLLVNDGSTDASVCIAESYAIEDQRIHLYHQENQGQATARNVGLDHATGEYILFIDADDTIDQHYLSTLLENIQDADILLFGYRRVTPEGSILEQKCVTAKRPYLFVSPCTRLTKRAFLQEHQLRFDTTLRYYEDVLFAVQGWKAQPTIRVIEYYGYNYTFNSHSTTSKQHNTKQIRRKLRKEGLSLFSFNGLRLRLIAHFIKERIR